MVQKYNSDNPPKRVTWDFPGITEEYLTCCISAKIYNKLLLLRIRPHIEPILINNQNGFRPNRGTITQILTLRRIVEGIKVKNLPAVLTFVDFRKAFDSIHRGKMLEILLAYGIPQSIVNAIGIMYNDTVVAVRTPDGDTDFFPILVGVLQGDTLAPFLFIMMLDYTMRIVTQGYEKLGFTRKQRWGSRHPELAHTDTEYADDIALHSDTFEDAQSLLHRVEAAAREIGLSVNETKTQYILYSNVGEMFTLGGDKLKCVQCFQCLGSWVGNTSKDMETRIAKAWSASSKLNKIWKSSLSRELKIQFSEQLYGAECWTRLLTL